MASPLRTLSFAALVLAACNTDPPSSDIGAEPPASAATTTPIAAEPPAETAVAAPEPTPETAEPTAEPEAAAPGDPPSKTGATPPAPKTTAPAGTAEPAKVATATPSATPPPDKPTGPVVGKPWQVVASIAADPGYKCNDAYPHKFVTSGGTHVTYPNPKPTGACSGKRAIAVSVPFVPTAAGPGSVSGTLRYGICDDAKTNCRIVKKAMTLPFTAAAE